MAEFILSCCSTVDLKKSHLEARDIKYICFHYEIDGRILPDDFGASMPFPDFYAAMENGAETRTSQINIDEYCGYFRTFLEQGRDILHIAFSGGLSGSVNSALAASALLAEEFPERKIIVIDSLAASSGYGLLMDKIADLRDGGMDIDTLAAWVEAHKLELHHWFFSTTLKYYIKGGRVSKTAGFVGGVLGICPLLHVDDAGKLIPVDKIRSKKKVIEAIVRKMVEYADKGTSYDGKCYISHSNCIEDASLVASLVEETFPKLNGRVEINDIGTVIGSHSGPGTVALFFWGKSRKE